MVKQLMVGLALAAGVMVPAPAFASGDGQLPPAEVVRLYYAAINGGDYELAWKLGGKNLHHMSYDAYVKGFNRTERDVVHVTGVHGDRVDVTLDAEQKNTGDRHFAGEYRVHNGVITSGHMQRTK